MLLDAIRIIVGLVALIYAADRLVKSAVRISRAFGVSVVLIGAVIVGFGTSVPEFVVSAIAALEGELDLAVANVVSSNTVEPDAGARVRRIDHPDRRAATDHQT